jgi:hypothetical protein
MRAPRRPARRRGAPRARCCAGPQAHHVAGRDLVRRPVDLSAVDMHVAVGPELARLGSSRGEPEPVHDVVEPQLEQPEEVLTRDAGLPGGPLEVTTELALEHAVVALGLLLLAQLERVLGLPQAAAAVLFRRIRPPVERSCRPPGARPSGRAARPRGGRASRRSAVASHPLYRNRRRGQRDVRPMPDSRPVTTRRPRRPSGSPAERRRGLGARTGRSPARCRGRAARPPPAGRASCR